MSVAPQSMLQPSGSMSIAAHSVNGQYQPPLGYCAGSSQAGSALMGQHQAYGGPIGQQHGFMPTLGGAAGAPHVHRMASVPQNFQYHVGGLAGATAHPAGAQVQ